jgi:NACHT domain
VAKHTFKTSGIARSGFEYQDLIGIEILLKFYRDPNLYNWVELESEDKATGKLDDVIVARRDNSFELLQVKFTADPGRYFLNWDWLLAKKGKSTSLLKKWSASLSSMKSLGRVHSARLRTNRQPDSEFSKVLNGTLVDFDKIPAARRNVVSNELGGQAAARAFFAQFEFSHSELLIDDLEIKLKGEIVPTDTDNTGWLLLREQARKWAIRKQYPGPDGKIRHEHLVQLITKRRPKPIPQDFEVPALYQIPAQTFHDGFTARIKTGPRPISVLWGTPGRGKSTYLSYLVDLLTKERLPVIRHHYFLSLDDSTTDRISFSDICSSLMDQMAGRYPDAVRGLEDAPNQLKKWIEASGKHFANEGKRFFVVIDGLDHVWREQRNISQMEHLFNYLLPCPSNVVLLIGTQKVAQEQLPLRLIQHAEEQDWIEVPPMDEDAVHAWLEGQKVAGRLLLRDVPQYSGVSEFAEVAHAFYELSQGNPLHLIYSFEALVRRGVVMTDEEVRLLPSCPDGDIRKYYGSLWGRLPQDAKKVLHLIAGSDFHWPTDGLRKCAGAPDEVDHLLEHRRTGVIPFHGSILAYARDQSDHANTFKAVLPAVVRWLEREAPEYWRWAWLWIMRARLGDPNDLLSNTTRQWVIDSLSKGWPPDQIVTILDHAEKEAFARDDYSKTIELRSIKIRVQNGQDYQINRFRDFSESAIRLSRNDQQVLNMADAIPSATDDAIVTLLRCLEAQERDGIGQECYEELRRQVNLWINLRHRPDEKFLSLAENFLEGLVSYGKPDINSFLRFITQFRERDRIYQSFLRQVVRLRNFEMANEMLDRLQNEKRSAWRNATQDAMARIAAAEGLEISARLATQVSVSPLLTCWYQLKGLTPPGVCNLGGLSPAVLRTEYHYGPNVDVETFFHAFFFSSLGTALSAAGECEPALVGMDRTKLGWMADGIRNLWEAALEMAKSPSDISFGGIFLALADLEPVDIPHRPSDPSMAQYRAFRNAVRQIATDLHALKCAVDGPGLVAREQFEIARASTHWIDESWISDELESRTLIFEPQGIKELINDLDNTASIHVTQINDRAERWIDLAQLSVLYGLEGGQRFISRAADCIIGYGWRKDVWVFDVLSAIASVHESNAANVLPWIDVLAPIIDQITVFTDGDETNHAPDEFVDLIAVVKPEWLPSLYSYYIANEEWRLAEITHSAILRQVDFTSPTGIALGKSLLEQADLHELEKLHKQGRAGVSRLLLLQRRFIGAAKDGGAAKTKTRITRKATTEDLGRGGKPPDVKKFGPHKLDVLLKRVANPRLGYLHREDSLLAWLRHWDRKGKGLEALRSIDEYFKKHENPHEIEPLLDEAFDVSLKYEGRAKAYVWLVRAQIERHGWSDHWDKSERIQRRLELVAKHYKDKWALFIKDTSRQPRYWERRRNGLTIGTRWLVKLLLLVGQNKLAIDYTSTMVRITKQEVSDQPLPHVEWAQ